jgi:hypothetical protein
MCIYEANTYSRVILITIFKASRIAGNKAGSSMGADFLYLLIGRVFPLLKFPESGPIKTFTFVNRTLLSKKRTFFILVPLSFN